MFIGPQSSACLSNDRNTSARVHLSDMGRLAAICNIRVTRCTAVPVSRSVTPIIADSGSVSQTMFGPFSVALDGHHSALGFTLPASL